MPNGAYPAGMDGSLKPPGIVTDCHWLLNTSTVPSWKLVAYRNVPLESVPIARPLYTEVGVLPGFSSAVATSGEKGSATGLQPLSWPDSESKMNKAAPVPPAPVTWKPVVGLNTWPVGLGPSPVEARPPGMFTVRGTFVTLVPPGAMLYRVATAALLSDAHSGVVGPNATPQGFFRLGSTIWAPWSPRSDTRLVCTNSFADPDPWPDAAPCACAGTTTAPTSTPAAPTVTTHLLAVDRRACAGRPRAFAFDCMASFTLASLLVGWLRGATPTATTDAGHDNADGASPKTHTIETLKGIAQSRTNS